MQVKNKIEKIAELLEKNYGKVERFHLSNPLDLLVETILSQNTNDRNRDKAFKSLKKHYKSYDDVLNSSEEELAKIIYSSGFYNIKAKRIKGALEKIKTEKKELNLEFLKEMGKEKAFNWLINIPGIGYKTAAIILAFGLNFPSIPVDTHIFRISKRLGLVPENFNREKTQEFLEENIQEKLKTPLHVGLIKHGREVCKAINPKCKTCFLQKECDYFKKKLFAQIQ